MAERDYESKGDEIERDNLQKAISEVETVLAGSTPGSRPFFETFLQNARGRVGSLDKKIRESEKERETRTSDRVVMAQMAAKEKALSAEEKKTFSGFMEKDFFTKKDFGSLEKFYANSWDRLSENGKDQMSKRVWEGIRRDEYTFGELPGVVREKEMEHAYKRLTGSAISLPSLSAIPEADRKEFIGAYESGDHKEASRILERQSFKGNMFRDDKSKPIKQASLETTRESERESLGLRIANGEMNRASGKEPPKQRDSAADVSDLNLDGIKLADAPAKVSASDIPSAKTAASKAEVSLRS